MSVAMSPARREEGQSVLRAIAHQACGEYPDDARAAKRMRELVEAREDRDVLNEIVLNRGLRAVVESGVARKALRDAAKNA